MPVMYVQQSVSKGKFAFGRRAARRAKAVGQIRQDLTLSAPQAHFTPTPRIGDPHPYGGTYGPARAASPHPRLTPQQVEDRAARPEWKPSSTLEEMRHNSGFTGRISQRRAGRSSGRPAWHD